MFDRRNAIGTLMTVAAAALLPLPVLAQDNKLVMQLGWLPNAATMGEVIALQKGFFAEAGLDVTLLPGGPTANPVQDVLSGAADVGEAYAPQIMYAVDRGLPITSFAATFQKAPLTFISLKESGIESVADWAGKRIGGSQSAVPQVKALLSTQGLGLDDITYIQADIPALLQGQADVVGTWPTNVSSMEPVINHPGGYNAQSIWDNGLQFQSNYLIARKDALESHPETFVSLLEAIDRGWAYAADHPDEALDLLIAYAPALDRETEGGALAVTLSDYIYTEDTVANGFGDISVERWQKTLDTYASIGEIKDSLTADEVLDRRILDAAERTHR